jgi:uncharacterized repeat protein (TIGR01451 family)
MKRGRYNILIVFVAVSLLACGVWDVLPGKAQTAVGTRILNVARGAFRFKTGAQDSLRSNVAETIVQSSQGLGASLEIDATPEAIVGNGQDTSTIRAHVRDLWGNPVPDGVQVEFTTTAGSFPENKTAVIVPTSNGIAACPLKSEPLAQRIVTARVTATTMSVSRQLLTAETSVLFFPGAIQGCVISALTGQAVRGAVVVTYDQAHTELACDTTSGTGVYMIPLPLPGRYTSTIAYQNQFGDPVHATFNLLLPIPDQGGIAPVPPLNAISGSILDRGTGQPIRRAGIGVCLLPAGMAKSAGGRILPAYAETDGLGAFQFDSLNPGTYEIQVTDQKLAGTIIVHDTVSGCFAVEANIEVLDRPSLEVVKTVSKRIVEIGDGVAYTLEIHNTSAVASLTNLTVVDQLPVGFALVRNSSRLDQTRILDPIGSRSVAWCFTDTLAPGRSTRLSYMTTIGAGAMDGDGLNHAYASARSLSGDSVRSAVASVGVVVRPGVFTDHGIVIGKVVVDNNANGLQDDDESGIAGVELWLEDGTHIVTGDDGKYSLPDVRPGQHVIRIDRRTLPVGSTVLAIGTESAGDGTSRFIRLVDGGVARADFHVAPPRQASLEMSVSSGSSSDRIRAMYAIRWHDLTNPSAISLVDSLPRGFTFDQRSLRLNGAAVTGSSLSTPTLNLALPIPARKTTDSVEVDILPDGSAAGQSITIRPSLVLNYAQRGTVRFVAASTFVCPAISISQPHPATAAIHDSGKADHDTSKVTGVLPALVDNRPAAALAPSPETPAKMGSVQKSTADIQAKASNNTDHVASSTGIPAASKPHPMRSAQVPKRHVRSHNPPDTASTPRLSPCKEPSTSYAQEGRNVEAATPETQGHTLPFMSRLWDTIWSGYIKEVDIWWYLLLLIALFGVHRWLHKTSYQRP